MTDIDPDFVTVSEAARRLGISERQVRRWAGRLADSDRLASGLTSPTSPARVRLSALEETRNRSILPLQDGARDLSSYPEDRLGPDVEPDATGTEAERDDRLHAGQGPDAETLVAMILAEKDRRIEELQSRVADIGVALEHEREAHRRAETLHLGTMGEMQRLQQRAAELESQNAKLIEALPVVVETPAAPTGDTEASDTGQSGVDIPAALAVDRERGWIDADGDGIGYTETIGGIALKLRGEVSGPKGRD